VERSSGLWSDISKGGRRMVVAYNSGVCLETPAHASSLTCAGSTCPKLHSCVMRGPRLEALNQDDSSTARHQPLYRDQTVSKRKDS
jgi:hypothetical protein